MRCSKYLYNVLDIDTHKEIPMIKWINKLVGNKMVTAEPGRKMTPEERYIMAQNPQDIRDVEFYSRQFERLSYNQRAFGSVYR